MGWIYVIFGGVFELVFTTCLRYVNGFKNVPWTIGFACSLAISMYLISMAMRTVPLGTAYAIWTGIGTLGTAVVGMIWYQEPVSIARIAFILLIVAAAVGLKMTSGH